MKSTLLRKKKISGFGLEVEILPLLHILNKKMVKTQENASQSIKYPSYLGNLGHRIEQWCEDFNRKLTKVVSVHAQ